MPKIELTAGMLALIETMENTVTEITVGDRLIKLSPTKGVVRGLIEYHLGADMWDLQNIEPLRRDREEIAATANKYRNRLDTAIRFLSSEFTANSLTESLARERLLKIFHGTDQTPATTPQENSGEGEKACEDVDGTRSGSKSPMGNAARQFAADHFPGLPLADEFAAIFDEYGGVNPTPTSESKKPEQPEVVDPSEYRRLKQFVSHCRQIFWMLQKFDLADKAAELVGEKRPSEHELEAIEKKFETS